MATIEKMITSVTKRDGRIVEFDPDKIKSAVVRAMESVPPEEYKNPQADIDTAAGEVRDQVIEKLLERNMLTPSIEQIQDVVEETLILMEFPKTAKHYILYRNERAIARAEARQVPPIVEELVTDSSAYFENPLAEFVYYRTYSRWLPDQGRRETWIESVYRYMGYMKSKLGDKLTREEYAEIQKYIMEMKSMPSMRLMWSAGAAADFDNACAYNCSYVAITELRDFAEILYLLMCGCGVGFSVEAHHIQQLPIVQKQIEDMEVREIVIEDSKQGWAEALRLGLIEWFRGCDVKYDYSELRPAGARLKTMGGRSSGPEPLRELLEFARMQVLANQGKRLSALDVHDIICKTGECVVAGGVRRSSLISLSDLDDIEMRDAKQGHFYIQNNHRQLANNSVAYKTKPTATEFMGEWLALAESGSGERGIFNRGSLPQQIPSRRLKALEGAMESVGTNPCVSIDTWVATTEGPRRVRELINRPFTAIVDGEQFICPTGFFQTDETMLYRIVTDSGFELKATKNHKVLTVLSKTRKTQRNIWKTVEELEPGDRIILNNHFEARWSGNGNHVTGWLLGNLLGDGNIEENGFANLDYWGETATVMAQSAESVSELAGKLGRAMRTGYGYRIHSRPIGELAEEYGMIRGNKVVTDKIEKASSDFYEGFLSGWFDADGSVQGNLEKGVSVRLSSSDLHNLRAAQRMLARLGIISKIYENRRDAGLRPMPDGQGNLKEYWCEANHELIISKDNIVVFDMRVGFSDPLKSAKLSKLIDSYNRSFNREPFCATVISKEPYGVNPVYDCQVDEINAFDANGLYVHNCGEIFLKSKQFCNLTEVVARADDTLASLKKKVRIAAILGTYQSMLTDFTYLSPEWKENCEQERLLGVSITGQWDSPEARKVDVQRWAKAIAVDTNIEYAERFGINQSTCVTCTKPSGTVSQLVNAASGTHPRYAKHYIRRVRISTTDPLFKMMKDQGVPCVPDVGQSVENAHTYVLEFPVKAPDTAVTRHDITAIQQLEYWKTVKENYTEHNPSTTIYVGDDEWFDVGHWVYKNWDIIGGLSFLPRDNSVYRLAPFEEISAERYAELAADFPRLNFGELLFYEDDDNTTGSKEFACVGTSCEIN